MCDAHCQQVRCPIDLCATLNTLLKTLNDPHGSVGSGTACMRSLMPATSQNKIWSRSSTRRWGHTRTFSNKLFCSQIRTFEKKHENETKRNTLLQSQILKDKKQVYIQSPGAEWRVRGAQAEEPTIQSRPPPSRGPLLETRPHLGGRVCSPT